MNNESHSMQQLVEAMTRVEEKLDIVVNLLAFLAAESQEGLGKKAIALRRSGIGPTQIAEICGTTANTISVALAGAKKRKKTAQRKVKA